MEPQSSPGTGAEMTMATNWMTRTVQANTARRLGDKPALSDGALGRTATQWDAVAASDVGARSEIVMMAQSAQVQGLLSGRAQDAEVEAMIPAVRSMAGVLAAAAREGSAAYLAAVAAL